MEFLVTEAMAAERTPDLVRAGDALGLPRSFVELGPYGVGDRADLERYLAEFTVQFFSVDELARPNHPEKAAEAGFDELIPPLHLWPWTMLVLTIGDRMRAAVGASVRLRNLWRPMSYNRLVARSGIESDHPNAAAGDFDFSSSNQRRTAEAVVRALAADSPELELSVGFGARSLHVGSLSPGGHRHWFYDSYPDERTPLR
ncbi:MAG TPA: hypothetical protein VK860_00775 [Ilumatobacteraceae bacterium]|nr:hypothetical protein [Ilumatobacteraceae bacterium]